MTKSQIKAELRRSACEDFNPFWKVSNQAYIAARKFCNPQEYPTILSNDNLRNLFLLVSEAL